MDRFFYRQLRFELLSSLILSLALLFVTGPITFIFSLLSRVWAIRSQSPGVDARKNPIFQPKTILITGISAPSGLALARIFHHAGHRVIGADFGGSSFSSWWLRPDALRKHYVLRCVEVGDGKLDEATFHAELRSIIKRNGVDLWIPCATASSTPSARDDANAKGYIEARTKCTVLHFDMVHCHVLSDEGLFLKQVAKLGFATPKKHRVTTRGSVYKMLPSSPGHKSIITDEDVTLDDASPRAGESKMNGDFNTVGSGNRPVAQVPSRKSPVSRKTLVRLPSITRNETFDLISRLPFSKSHPRTLHVFPKGKSYTVSVLVVRGEITAFVAYTMRKPKHSVKKNFGSVEMLPPPARNVLCRRLYDATELLISEYIIWPSSNGASESPSTPRRNLERSVIAPTRVAPNSAQMQATKIPAEALTGHLVIPFTIEENFSAHGIERVVYPLPWTPRLDPLAMVFMQDDAQLAKAYLSALLPTLASSNPSTSPVSASAKRTAPSVETPPPKSQEERKAQHGELGSITSQPDGKRVHMPYTYLNFYGRHDRSALPAGKDDPHYRPNEDPFGVDGSVDGATNGSARTNGFAVGASVVFLVADYKFYSLAEMLRTLLIEPLSETRLFSVPRDFVSWCTAMTAKVSHLLREKSEQILALTRHSLKTSTSSAMAPVRWLLAAPTRMFRRGSRSSEDGYNRHSSTPTANGHAEHKPNKAIESHATKAEASVTSQSDTAQSSKEPISLRQLIHAMWQLVARVISPEWRDLTFDAEDAIFSLWRLHVDGLVRGKVGWEVVAGGEGEE